MGTPSDDDGLSLDAFEDELDHLLRRAIVDVLDEHDDVDGDVREAELREDVRAVARALGDRADRVESLLYEDGWEAFENDDSDA